MTGFRHIERGILPRYSSSVRIRIYASGQKRVKKVPSKQLLLAAFRELGTQAAVASAFGVTRGTIKRWTQNSGIEVVSRPEAGLANLIRRNLATEVDKSKISQWLMDEGSVSVAYNLRENITYLVVCGSMNDYEVLSSISEILDTKIGSSKLPGSRTLPMGALRVNSARAYALLEVLLPYLVGLKAREAEAALKFFPPNGIRKGRHTTEEFLTEVWKDFSLNALHEWNKRRKIKMGEQEILERARTWFDGRIKRARRFVDAYKGSNGGEFNLRSSS